MAELHGYFVYSETAKGNFNFRLKASNKETIAVSEGVFKTKSACLNGIKSVINFCATENVDDQSLQRKSDDKVKFPKFEIYLDKQGKYRYRLYANNGNLLCISEEGYASRTSCKNGIASVGKWAPTAVIVSDAEFNGK